jgi:hypothetical protein
LAKNKQAPIELKKSAATREQMISDVQRVHKLFPQAVITRDFFRTHSKYIEKAWTQYFSTFSDLVREANAGPEKREPAYTAVLQSVSTADKLQLEQDKLAAKRESTKRLLDEALNKINKLEGEREAILNLRDKTPQISVIQPREGSHGESVAVFVASDWHIEENVDPACVGYKNEFNLKVAEERATKFFQGAFRLFDILRRDTTIKTVILGLLGDFISNTIHEDLAETNNLGPADAIYKAECLIVSGIKFLLEQIPPDVEIFVVAHAGNHGRMTKKQRGSSESSNSLEHFMYYHIRDLFSGEPRIKFQIAEGYHTFTRLFEERYTIRWHHGHAIKYGGGVGGIYVPILKALNQWNKAEWADLDILGHFHQATDAGNFVANGSLIGYNDFAVRIKADFEEPKQMFLLVNRKWNSKTMVTPIFLE